ncbi:hypothetical protein AVEN_29431-1 [Araneus ventricosus]|uniref:Uncharacterized protein n=1 Tax=Araneus ventricosus TaxID=182803 RepID=A0A4Y2CZP4_ARAVE|nr:hypothetical protein AVEN_29431-1 [Araneus ventricosus]
MKYLLKAGHSPLLHFGIFGTPKGKTHRQGLKPMKFGILTNSKSKTPSADSNLGPRCEASGKTIVLPRLGPRVETRNETRNPPCARKRSVGGRNSATLNLVSEQTLEHP